MEWRDGGSKTRGGKVPGRGSPGRRQTPIWVTSRVRNLLVVAALSLLALPAYAAPAVPLVAAGGFALGLWVALTAVVPLVGAWIEAAPGILVAL